MSHVCLYSSTRRRMLMIRETSGAEGKIINKHRLGSIRLILPHATVFTQTKDHTINYRIYISHLRYKLPPLSRFSSGIPRVFHIILSVRCIRTRVYLFVIDEKRKREREGGGEAGRHAKRAFQLPILV